MSNSFVAAQLGARMRYAVPRILARAGQLERFYTDLCASKGWPRLLGFWPASARPKMLKRLLGRSPNGLPAGRIRAFNSFGRRYAARRRAASTREETLSVHLWAGRTFCRKVAGAGFDGATAIYVFNSAGLEVLEAAREQGRLAVMEQTIAPLAFETQLLAAEAAKFPEWEQASEPGPHAADFCRREALEWEAADRILCGSQFVKQAIASRGGPAHKCVVVPYGVDMPFRSRRQPERPQFNGKRPIRVLTVGAVGLRKGAPYVLAAARLLGSRAEFRMVGSITVSKHARTLLGEFVDLRGPVPHSEIQTHFAWADVFLLPSLCEGSATATYEALALGVPVICTPNTGSVVIHGADGFVVPVADARSIAAHIEDLAKTPGAVEEMSRNAFKHAEDLTLAAYGDRLLAALGVTQIM